MEQLKNFLENLKPKYDDDTVDRLNYFYTGIIMALFSIFISAKQYSGEPIQCWVPAQFKDWWEQYAENYCFVENTYFVPMHDGIPTQTDDREKKEISYYQWVPIVLALNCLIFYIPRMVWRLLNWQSGLNVMAIVTEACDAKNINKEDRKKVVGTVAKHIQQSINLQRDFGGGRNPLVSYLLGCGKREGIYVTLVYLFVKVLFIINIICQFLILNKFLGPSYTWWGVDVLRDVVNGREWKTSGHFPRVTLCDFEVREVGNIQRHTIQCVLMINMFNEKFFLFLWWWFFIVAVITILNFLYWVVVSIRFNSRKSFIYSYLRTWKRLEEVPFHYDKFNRWVKLHLRPDGVFALRLVSENAGDVLTRDLVVTMWKNYLRDVYSITLKKAANVPEFIEELPTPTEKDVPMTDISSPHKRLGQEPTAPPPV